MKDMTTEKFESPALQWVFNGNPNKPSTEDLGRTAIALIEAEAKLSNVLLDTKKLAEQTEKNIEFIRSGLAKINTELNG
jgi:hypothetical protein